MISRPSDRESSRRRRFGLGGSLIAHVIALAIFVALVPFFIRPEPQERPTTHELVTITRRSPHPTPAPVAVRPPPTPTPEPTTTPTPPPVVAKPSHVAPQTQVVPTTPRRAPSAPSRPTVPHIARIPVRPIARAPHGLHAPPAATRLSQTNIDRIDGDLAKSIAHDRGKIDPLHVAYATPAPPKDYGPAASTFDVGDARNGHGLCDPIKSWTDQGFDYYFVSCNVHLSDGTFERQGVPWPVRFPPGDDPFNGTAHADRPLAMPLPGWTLAAGETISPQLRDYAAAHGVTL